MRFANGVARSLVAVLLGLGLAACQPGVTYTYRIATKGPVAADVGEFAREVDRTLSDPRGWSLGGSIEFRRTTGSSDFVLWLSAAPELPSFSPGCSPQWSCRVGSDVVINETRWVEATPSWPGSTESYRHYLVNHEVGHWLGLGHRWCGTPGRRAPVMAQQSKGGDALGGCRHNVWPTDAELDEVARVHGVVRLPPGDPDPGPERSVREDPLRLLRPLEVPRDADPYPAPLRLAGWATGGERVEGEAATLRCDVAQWRGEAPGVRGRIDDSRGRSSAG